MIEEIIRYCKDIQKLHEQYRSDFEKYETEIAYQYAVNLCLIQIGEATGKLIHIDHVVNDRMEKYLWIEKPYYARIWKY